LIEIIIVLLALLLVLGSIALVGHIIWIAAAWALKQLFRLTGPASRETPRSTRCPGCGALLPPQAPACHACGWSVAFAPAGSLPADLAATARQVERFRRRGLIDEATYRHLIRLVADEQRGPVEGSARTVPPPERIAPLQQESALLLAPATAATDRTPADEHGRAQEATPAPLPQTPLPGRPLSEVFASFMEQSNIRWGELVGGLLIIGCSTALVISLWAQISRIPAFRFFIFTGVTAALFGAGLYTEHRWKLPTTSRGLLIIAALLVPLNFLAIAAISSSDSTDLLVIGSELLAPAIFLGLTYYAGRILTPGWPSLLAGGLLGSSVAQLLVRHFAGPEMGLPLLLALGLVPFVCYGLAIFWMLRALRQRETIDESAAHEMFIMLGTLAFAALVPYGLLLFKAGQPGQRLEQTAPLVALFGLPLLAGGLTLWRRATAPGLAAARVIGTSIGLFGAVSLLASLALAWPNPACLLAVALIDFAAFAAMAVYALPAAHALSLACLALAYLTGLHIASGRLDPQTTGSFQLLGALLSMSSGRALVPYFALLAGAAEWLALRKRPVASRHYTVTAWAAAIASLLLVTGHGFGATGEGYTVSLIYAFYAAAAFLMAWRHELAAVCWVGSLLALLALAQTLLTSAHASHPWQAALLAHASAAAGAGLIARRSSVKAQRVFSGPLARSSLASSLIIALSLLAASPAEAAPSLSARVLWLAAVWLALSLLNESKAIFTAFQATLTIGIALALRSAFGNHRWTAEYNVTTLALSGVAWLGVDLYARRRNFQWKRSTLVPSFHHIAALLSLMAVGSLVLAGLTSDLLGMAQRPDMAPGWLALTSAFALMICCLWDPQAKYAAACLYALGLLAAGMAFDAANLSPHWLGWAAMILCAAYATAASALWRRRDALMRVAARLGVPNRLASPAAGLVWLVPAGALLALSTLLLAFWALLTFVEAGPRFSAAAAVGAQAMAMALLAQGPARPYLQRTALAFGVAGCVLCGWAWLQPGSAGAAQNRAVIMMVIMCALVALYGTAPGRLSALAPGWAGAARALVPWLVGLGCAALVFILSAEVVDQAAGGSVNLSLWAVIAVATALTCASAACIVFAVSPGHDPLALSESGRARYVYAAEMLLALLFMHIRLAAPWLFSGFFAAYWPLVVIMLAYLGVFTGEILRRRGSFTLARPLERTGAFLPVLPVLGFWVLGSAVHYSGLLLLVGLLYGTLSIMRRSFGFGLLAALACNGGLWYLLHHTQGYRFFNHPQLWLIPAALSALAAAHLNRDRLSSEQMTAVRYVALMMIYVSSTADIFINGVGASPWLPLALAALSIAGVMCGIIWRVRAFLFLGSTFLLLAVVTIIWHAAASLGWTWLWYVAGIAAGAVIIFVFALFEKKRGEVLRVVDELRGWQG
jgi:hypothetical protein